MSEQRKEWPRWAIAELCHQWNLGTWTAEISARLNMLARERDEPATYTKNGIVGKAHRLHLSGRPSPIKRTFGRRAIPKPPRNLKAKGGAPKNQKCAPTKSATIRIHAVDVAKYTLSKTETCPFIKLDPAIDATPCGAAAIYGKSMCPEHWEHCHLKKTPKPRDIV